MKEIVKRLVQGAAHTHHLPIGAPHIEMLVTLEGIRVRGRKRGLEYNTVVTWGTIGHGNTNSLIYVIDNVVAVLTSSKGGTTTS
jgi:hypothetical protein